MKGKHTAMANTLRIWIVCGRLPGDSGSAGVMGSKKQRKRQ